jgi:Cft2 family RNA processing exonuclease
MATQFEWAKWIPGTKFLVDGFRHCTPECQHYFLTHAHSDHTIGLFKSWRAGTIHCTAVTARLLIEEQGIARGVVHAVQLNEPFIVEGVEVVALDANHCPGSAMFLFSVPSDVGTKKHILHTGDFRFHPRMVETPALRTVKVHALFLDTTYAAPRWSFPAQEIAIDMMVDTMRKRRKEFPGAVPPYTFCNSCVACIRSCL